MSTQQVKEIFDEARRLVSGEQEAFVRGRCREDATLAERVLGLLRDLAKAGDFLNVRLSDTAAHAAAADGRAGEGPGCVIGRYELVQLIGEGGFGSVFMAAQLQPVRRMVAL